MEGRQLGLGGESEEYRRFLAKFEPRRTTDDCFTPENIYGAVAAWVAREYGLDRSRFVRPFWPGADYRDFDYPDGCVVVDNPPFSILSQIIRWYRGRGIPFFLFAPAKTAFCGGLANAVCVGLDITYDNGATIATSFVTSLGDRAARSAPDLHRILKEADRLNRRRESRPMRRLAFPDAVVTAMRLSYLSAHGVEFGFGRGDAAFVRSLDNLPSGVYGGGYLLSERAAAERAAAERAAAERVAAEGAAAERVALSERERRIQLLLTAGTDGK